MKKVSALILVLMVSGIFSCFVSGCGGGGKEMASGHITSITPAEGATGVVVTRAITVVFNADIDETTLTAANVYLTRANGVVNVPGTIAYNAASKTLTFTPRFPMVGGALYTFTMTHSVMTKAVNAAGDFTSTFTTQNVPILYTSNSDVAPTMYVNAWSMAQDGSNVLKLTNYTTDGFVFFIPPLWSPDYTRVVYMVVQDMSHTLPCNIYVMNADGSGQTNATGWTANSGTIFYRWFPDGSKILFVFTPDGTVIPDTDRIYDLASMNPDGTNFLNFTNLPTGRMAFPLLDFSPDGTKIVYSSGEDDGGPVDIHTINSDGTGDVQLTNVGVGNEALLPLYSPDGTQIYYSSGTDSTKNMYRMNADGSNVETIVSVSANQGAVLWGISPDGTQILYTVEDDTLGLSDLYVANIDGSSAVKITNATAGQYVQGALWSPDGSRIAYTFGKNIVALGDPINLFVVNRDGTNNTNLTNYAAGIFAAHPFLPFYYARSMSWSTDGAGIVYIRYDKNVENMNIDFANADGSGITHLTNNTAANSDSLFGDWW